MRCKACNASMILRWTVPFEGGAPFLEDMCPNCLYIVRAINYDGGPENELDNLFLNFGIWYEPDDEDSEE